MKLKDQVCSLGLAKKLKELGVKQEGLFYWATDGIRNWLDIKIDGLFYDLNNFQVADDDFYERNEFYQYSAPTVAELGERLPKTIKKGKLLFHLKIYYDTLRGWAIQYNFWHCGCASCSCGINKVHKKTEEWLLNDSIYANTLTNAMAKMLIYLRENKLLKR